MHRFRDMATLVANHLKYLPQSHLGVTPCEFFDESYLARSEIMGLSDGVHFTILLSLC